MSQQPLTQKVGVAVALAMEVVFLGLDFVGLVGGLVVDLLEVVLVQLGFQVVLPAPVGWEVVLLVCLEVVEGVGYGFEVTVDNFGMDVGFVAGDNSGMLLQAVA